MMELRALKRIYISIREGSVAAVYMKDAQCCDVIVIDHDLRDSDTLSEPYVSYIVPMEITEVPEEYRKWIHEEK